MSKLLFTLQKFSLWGAIKTGYLGASDRELGIATPLLREAMDGARAAMQVAPPEQVEILVDKINAVESAVHANSNSKVLGAVQSLIVTINSIFFNVSGGAKDLAIEAILLLQRAQDDYQ